MWDAFHFLKSALWEDSLQATAQTQVGGSGKSNAADPLAINPRMSWNLRMMSGDVSTSGDTRVIH